MHLVFVFLKFIENSRWKKNFFQNYKDISLSLSPLWLVILFFEDFRFFVIVLFWNFITMLLNGGWILSEPFQTENSCPSLAPAHVFLLFAWIIQHSFLSFFLRFLLVEYKLSQFLPHIFQLLLFLLHFRRFFLTLFFSIATKSLILAVIF